MMKTSLEMIDLLVPQHINHEMNMPQSIEFEIISHQAAAQWVGLFHFYGDNAIQGMAAINY